MNVYQANSLPSSGYYVIICAYTLFRNLDILSLKVSQENISSNIISFFLKQIESHLLNAYNFCMKTGRLYRFSGNALLSLSWSRFGKMYEAVQSLFGLVPRGL